jgi:hypothetical protein
MRPHITQTCIVRGMMDGPRLLKALMESASPAWNSNSLAKRVGMPSRQPQIYRFLNRTLTEPKRDTLRPVAEFFGVPVEAFYDRDLAYQVARERGFVVGGPPVGEAASTLDADISALVDHLCRLAVPLRPTLRSNLSGLINEVLATPENLKLRAQVAKDIESMIRGARLGEDLPEDASPGRGKRRA